MKQSASAATISGRPGSAAATHGAPAGVGAGGALIATGAGSPAAGAAFATGTSAGRGVGAGAKFVGGGAGRAPERRRRWLMPASPPLAGRRQSAGRPVGKNDGPRPPAPPRGPAPNPGRGGA